MDKVIRKKNYTAKEIANIVNLKDNNFRELFGIIFQRKHPNDIFFELLNNLYVTIEGLRFYFMNEDSLYGIVDMLVFLSHQTNVAFKRNEEGEGVNTRPRFYFNMSRVLMVYDVDKLEDTDIDYLLSQGDDLLSNFVKVKFKYNDFSEKPEWVSKKEGEDITMLKNVGVGESMDGIDMHFDEIYDIFDGFIIDEEDEEDKKNGVRKFNKNQAIISYLSTVSGGDLDKDKLDESIQQFRVWGPLNRGEHDCCGAPGGEGPCRMLYCTCVGGDDEEMEKGDDYEWFTGRCDECMKIIKNKSCCIRRPLVGGGWGPECYCSSKCLIESNMYRDSQEDLLIKTVLDKLTNIGIMDRSI